MTMPELIEITAARMVPIEFKFLIVFTTMGTNCIKLRRVVHIKIRCTWRRFVVVEENRSIILLEALLGVFVEMQTRLLRFLCQWIKCGIINVPQLGCRYRSCRSTKVTYIRLCGLQLVADIGSGAI